MDAPNRPDELVPAGWSDVAPILVEVIDRWHAAEAGITDWDAALAALPARHPEGWAATVERLQLINTFQWHEEDKSRDHGADLAVLGAIKQSIDASNRRRVQQVDRLDDIIHTGLKAQGAIAADAPLNSETPGSIIDRLSVLALKVYHVGEARAALPDGPEAAAMGERLATLTGQRDDLGGCLDNLLAGIRNGRVGLRFYRQVKVYQRPGTDAVSSDLD